MTQFYGQSQPPEDAIAAAVFGDDFIGTAVDVGSYDGMTWSNTYFFYQRGWKCINFEPHPENYARLCINQPKAINASGAVGARDYEAKLLYTAPGKPIVTGFDLPQWYIDSEVPGGRKGLVTIKKETVTLNTVLYSHAIDAVDYVSIDTDGTELDVLNGFDLTRWQPRLMIIEFNHALTEITDYLSSCGYTLAHTNLFNGFWTRTQADCDAVRRAVQS